MVKRGLQVRPRQFEPMFFYDERGSALFEEITQLPEYYLTRHELSILEAHSADILDHFPEGCALTELGSGSGKKTRTFLKEAASRNLPFSYTAIDISGDFLRESLARLQADYPTIPMTAMAGEYQSSLRALPASPIPRLILLMGSNIGNMSASRATELLHCIQQAMRPDDRVLIGFDRVKDSQTLIAAYDDSAGVTAKFNLHLLERLQAELGAVVTVDDFNHEARWNAEEERMEMYLVPLRSTKLRIPSLGIAETIEPEEPIWTEISQKFSMDRIQSLLASADLQLCGAWHSANEWFTVAMGAPKG